MRAFRPAAAAALARRFAGRAESSGHVQRLGVDVELDGRREIVSLLLRDGELSWSCTCAVADCAHAQAALSFLTEGDGGADDAAAGDELLELPRGGADRRFGAESLPPPQVEGAALVEVLRDLVMALVRSGVEAGPSPSVADCLQRLQRAAPSPLPLGVSRFIGRLSQALEERDVDAAACALEAASRLLGDLQAAASPEARCRLLSWLGARSGDAQAPERISNRTLIELGRERLRGVERAALERRYLIDAASGELFREEHGQGAHGASIGPCPRAVTVWLAEVEPTTPPRRMHLLQYAVTPAIDPQAFAQLGAHASSNFEALLDRYRSAVRAYPGLAEPVALLAPAAIRAEGVPALLDDAGRALPLHAPANAALPARLCAFAEGAEPLWVLGRLVDRDRALAIAPLAALVRREGRVCYLQA